ncbi:DEAD/DEAH box helicase [Streptomyces zagrosensis]|uniref:Superfamily II DNA/RNA helicase n=1 Tax=Streptomyces zagrosensis TaxID=1042984 RepID=A0A7W9UWQ3_9ACTN|nr:DEAD/DEAH box helicase [Streptomyces zagrosensis]MBB5933782.1 superfamily II DNA/RNA helicase [Streptomyces zagrosensis]
MSISAEHTVMPEVDETGVITENATAIATADAVEPAPVVESAPVVEIAPVVETVDADADADADAAAEVVADATEVIEAVQAVETAEVSGETGETAEASDEAVETAEASDESAETAEASDESAEKSITFTDLGLPEQVVRKLNQNGVTTPFPIQVATIPDAMAGLDILGRGRTGSGKTLSFGLPLLTQLSGGFTEKKRPRGLILTPTRELAMQVSDALQPYGDVLGLKLKVVCGGTSMSNQIYALERGVDILVATPGRLRDIINRGAASLDRVQVAVLDEADQMADMGFLPEVTEILDLVPSGGQRMLFSATLENEIDTLVKRYLSNPKTHEVDAAQGAVTTMSHHVLVVKPKDKAPVTAAIAARKGRTIIFVRTQMGADRVAEQLVDAGVRADALHGGMTQGARTRTLADFKEGYVNVLVATDVAARGIHVDGIDLVLNVDPAGDHKDYLHRSGRTARAGQSGTVVSLALPHQRKQIFRLMEDAGVDASRHIVGGAGVFDADVAHITGARSLTEVQAESAANSAKQAERDVQDLSRQLEKVQRRAAELRDEANRLLARAARERGEDPAAVVPATASAATDTADTSSASVPEQSSEATAQEGGQAQAGSAADSVSARAEQPAASAPSSRPEQERGGDERRDDRGNFDRRDRRDDRPQGGSQGGNRSGGFRRDERPSGGFRRDDRRDDRGGRSFERRDERPSSGVRRDERPSGGFRRDDRPTGGFRRDERRDDRGGRSFERRDDRRDDRGGRSFERRDERPSSGVRRDERPSGGFRRDDRPTGGVRRDDRPASGGFRRDERSDDRGGRSFERRDERPSGGFRRDERPTTGGFRRDDRPSGGARSDRPFNRDRRDERPAGGHRPAAANTDRPHVRRDDHRSTGTGTGTGTFGRRDDKPRWKRNS